MHLNDLGRLRSGRGVLAFAGCEHYGWALPGMTHGKALAWPHESTLAEKS